MARQRKPKSEQGAAPVPSPGSIRVGGATQRGRLASDIPARPVEWILSGWLPRGCLSMIVGVPGSGKSSMLAHLVSLAKHALILPGNEEDVALCLIPRLIAAGVRLERVRVLDDRPYTFPVSIGLLEAAVTGWEADLIAIDPLDSYLHVGGSENDGQVVRDYLESLARLATTHNVTVVGVRHPGKDRANVCPGSRQWRAVPRRIVQLDDDCGEPPTRLVRCYKPGIGPALPPVAYSLTNGKGGAPKWSMESVASPDVAALAAAVDGPASRSKLMEACQLLAHLFTLGERPPVEEYVGQCRSLGIGEHARDEAKRLMGVRSRPDAAGAKWYLYRTAETWPGWFVPADEST